MTNQAEMPLFTRTFDFLTWLLPLSEYNWAAESVVSYIRHSANKGMSHEL